MDTQKIAKYFGFGTNKDFDMMAHMVGNFDLKGEPGKLLGYELCIQNLNQIRDIIPPDSPVKSSPQAMIRKSFGDSFDLYVSRPKEGAVIYGTIWDLTPRELELVREWELVDYGMQEDAKAMAVNSKGEIIQVITQSLLKEPRDVDRIISEENYDAYVAPKEEMLKMADKVRADYLGTHS